MADVATVTRQDENGTKTTKQVETVRAIEECLRLSESFFPEVETLIVRLEGKLKALVSTGLTTWLRSLQRDQQDLRRNLEEINTTDPRLEDRIKKVSNKVYGSITNVQAAHLKWTILKQFRSFLAINRSFLGTSKQSRREAVSSANELSGHEKSLLHRELKEQSRVDVDVVEDGAEWICIRTINLDRLARQMTDVGWGWGEHEPGDLVDEEEWIEMPLAKQVKRLVEAAKLNRCNYRIPKVRVIMPRLQIDANEDVAIFVDQLHRFDPHVQVIFHDGQDPVVSQPPPPIETALENLVGDDFAGLTPTLNMDHTILIDLISDLTHLRLEPQEWQAPTTQSQIIEENQHPDGLMAPSLYPLLRGRKLVCTLEAAEHFHEVLSTVGTDTERQRGHLLIPNNPETRAMPPQEIHDAFCALSVHPPPPDVQIPVTILSEPMDFEEAVREGRLPEVAIDVARCGGFKSSKLSIYMYGWAEDLVTITSNKEISGQITTWVEANRKIHDELGPNIYRIDTTRNLLAKAATPPTPPRRLSSSEEDGKGHDDE